MPAHLYYLTVLFLIFMVLHYAHVGLWVATAWHAAGRRQRADDVLALDRAVDAPRHRGVSVIMPAYNEGPVVVDAVRSALRQQYPFFEIIVINDGSTDDTLQCLNSTFLLIADNDCDATAPLPTDPIRRTYRSAVDPRIRVVDKDPAGSKAGASNAGINAAHYPWVAVMDADELMEPDVLALCMDATVRSTRPVIAVGATLLPVNDCRAENGTVVDTSVSRNYWVGCQTVEYLQAFLITRAALSCLDSLLFVSGGFGLFLRDAVLAAGGYQPGHFGEDMDICIRMQRHYRDSQIPYAMVHVPEAVVWTEVPDTRHILRRQRLRWQWGLAQVVHANGDLLQRRRYGNFGRIGYGTVYFKEWWGTAIETGSWIVLALITFGGWLDLYAFVALLLCVQAIELASLGLTMSIVARRLRVFNRPRDVVRVILWGVVSGWGYRQLTLWWRIRAGLARQRAWGEMDRRGFAAPPAVPAMADG